MKPKYEKGHWQVTRFCCTSGNCFECLGESTRKRIVHTYDVSEDWAHYVAHNWKMYESKAELMPTEGVEQ